MIEPRPKVPVFEKEVIEADARRRGGDYDRVSSTSIGSLTWKGVIVSSRYSDASELELMLDMVSVLRSEELALVSEIFCDSKRGNDFSVKLSRWDEAAANIIGQKLDRVATTKSYGHSGITVHRGDVSSGGPSIEIEADFSGDVDEGPPPP